jgi:hypothetical protein
MKTNMKKLTWLAFISFIIFTGNVNATERERKALIHESIEAELKIEDWMTNESVWERPQVKKIEFAQEQEPGLKLENWMIDETLWEPAVLIQEKEEVLIVESWMSNENFWNR